MIRKTRTSTPTTLVLLASLLCGMPADASGQAPIARYHVSYVSDRLFEVTATFRAPTRSLSLYHFPSAQRPDGQAASIVDLRAFDDQSQPVPIEYTDNGRWRTPRQAASRIKYRLRADHDAVPWGPGKDEVATRFDSTYFFVGDAFFLVNHDWPVGPIEVEFTLPRGWRVIAPWDGKGARRRASGPFDLAHNAFAIGRDSAVSFRFDSLEITWLSSSELAMVQPDLAKVLGRLPSIYTAFWNGSPVHAFTVFTFADPQTDGGAFRNSFAMRIATPVRPVESIVWSQLLGHELMHLWNGSGPIRTSADGSAYWFVEGVTDYLTVKLMRAGDMLDDDVLAQRLANIVRRYMIGHHFTPGVTLSAAGGKKSEHWNLLYGGGALLGLLLDAELSAQDRNAFREAMRAVYAEGGEPYDHQRLMARLDRSTNGLATRLLAWIDAGPDASQIRERLARSGIEISTFANDEVYVRFAGCHGRATPCAPSFLFRANGVTD